MAPRTKDIEPNLLRGTQFLGGALVAAHSMLDRLSPGVRAAVGAARLG